MSAALLENFNLLATSVGGVARMRELILSLAVRGRLVPQDPSDEPASELLKRIRAEKDRLIKEGKISRDKPLVAITDDEQPFELPTGWEWVRLSTLLSKIGAGSTPLGGKEVYTNSGVKFLRSQNVWNNGLHLTDVALIPAEVHARMSGTVVLAQDILFNITGASIGRCALVPDDFDEANVSQHVTIIRPALTEIRHFLHVVLTSNHVQQTVMDVQVGVSREGLSIGKLGQFVIPLPPLAEQSRIVAKVEELMALCDRLEAEQGHAARVQGHWVDAALDQLAESADADEFRRHWLHLAAHFDTLFTTPESIDRLDATLLQLAVRGKLVPQDPNDEPASELLKQIRAEKERLIKEGKVKRDKPLAPITDDERPYQIPKGWHWVRLAETCSQVTDGEHITPERVENPTEVPLVTAKNVRNGYMDYTVTDFVPRAVAEKCWTRCKPEVGDILMVSVGATLGRLSVLRETQAMVLVRSVTLLRPIASVCDKNYLALHLNSPATQTEIWQSVKQSAQPCLYLAKSCALGIALPPLAEQSRIVAKVEELQSLTASLKTLLTAAQTKQAHLAEALISELTTPTPAEFDAETRFALRTQRGQGREVTGLALLDKAARQ
ncbi:restriction endonuclease subunit S [Thauera sp. 2A1]|uniref:restriction endonuclease subunit S n=1 Tax=Thauera sp. 2A1 TaxID=2570191 RepID=UPI001291FA7C|nr:restriction endonuclease subunit S [Thauera sp. 2A1]KAI5913904.1 restriction endonuclease subunit S [Thauera sp. 2A1]